MKRKASRCSTICRRLLPQPAILALLLLVGIPPGSVASRYGASVCADRRIPQDEKGSRSPAPDGHPYLDDPLKKIIRQVPELKGIRPAADQQELAMILRRTGREVDEFFENVVDLVAREEIKQERDGIRSPGKPFEDSYLIVRHKEEEVARFDEFRMDSRGNRIDEGGPHRGFLVTSGFALISMQFSTSYQFGSRFLHLGDQKVDKRDTYVVAFAQMPGEDNLGVTMKGPNGRPVHILMQGVAWVDKEDFHILRMRTDLLSEEPPNGLEEQTTKVDFGEVRLKDVAAPLWLPRDVEVSLKLGPVLERPFEVRFKNVHRYTDYRRYRVTTKMVAPAE